MVHFFVAGIDADSTRSGDAVLAETSAVGHAFGTAVGDQSADGKYEGCCDDSDYDGCRVFAVHHLIFLLVVDCHSYCPCMYTASAVAGSAIAGGC